MSSDPLSASLLAELQSVDQPTLWFADENVGNILESVNAQPLLTVISNRFDIWQAAKRRQIQAIFSDFDIQDYPKTTPTKKIIYRISKERALVYHLLNQAATLLGESRGDLYICGFKQEGIKTCAEKLIKIFNASGKLKKCGQYYAGHFSQLNASARLDDQCYPELRPIKLGDKKPTFFSKPGVYGWNKVDTGTELLLQTLKTALPTLKTQPQNVLDLGCGYGWIFMNLDDHRFDSITATDNNAAAITCARTNAHINKLPVQVIASDCADTVEGSFDLILCNPPFHQGFKHQKQLAERFICAAERKISKTGAAIFVVNEFIAIESIAKNILPVKAILAKDRGFKVLLLQKSR